MKMKLCLCVLLTCLFLMPMSVKAQGPADFFYSAGGVESGLVVNGDLDLTVTLGDTVSIYGFWSTNGPADTDLSVGAGFDIATSVDGIIEFNAAETFDFDIVLASAQDIVVGTRYDALGGGGFAGTAESVGANSIEGLNAFSVTAEGILESNTGPVFLDTGYDIAGDAFLFGRIDFTALEVGSVDLLTTVGSIGAVNGADSVVPTFGAATINVVVPEPNSAVLIGAVLTLFGCARRRKGVC